jgi:hypothetical protein
VGTTSTKDDTDSIVARAEGEADEGDLRGAVSTLQGLKGQPASAAASWIHDASNRVTVDAAEAEMSRIALDRLAAGNQPAAQAPGAAQ